MSPALLWKASEVHVTSEALIVGAKAVETYATRQPGKFGSDSQIQVAIWAKEQGRLKKEER